MLGQNDDARQAQTILLMTVTLNHAAALAAAAASEHVNIGKLHFILNSIFSATQIHTLLQVNLQ